MRIRQLDLFTMIKKTFLFVFILLNAIHSYGENYNGRILTKKGSPIREAVVINTTRGAADYTNDEGYFTIQACYGDSLLISCAGSNMQRVYSDTLGDIVFTETREDYFYKKPRITKQVINQVSTLYLSEKYKECISYCIYYIGVFPEISPYESHPYRDWGKKKWFLSKNKPEDIATLCYWGAISAYQYSLSKWDKTAIFEGIEWSMACAAFYDDYLHEETPKDYWSAENMYKYITYGEMGIAATNCGEHFLSALRDDNWVKKERKWYDKKSDRIFDILHKNTSNKEALFSEYPLLQYKITSIRLNHILAKGNLKVFQKIYLNQLEAVKTLINQSKNNFYYSVDASDLNNPQVSLKQTISDVELYNALNYLISLLQTSVIDSDCRKKIGNNFERFCMEQLIKLQDMLYSLNGSSIYSLSPEFTLRDIQNRMKDEDCVIMHFEAPVAPGRFYISEDLGTKYRNYAFIVTKYQETPDLWHRGFISDSKVNDLSEIKKKYPKANRFYFVGTPRMSFIDIAGTDSSIVRLHSLSQLLEQRTEKVDNEITFIGDLNYGKIGEVSSVSEYKGGDEFEELIGPAKELMRIKELFTKVRPICGDDAKRNVVTSEISRSKGILHISTHGHQFSSDYEFEPEDLILRRNIMENSRLILSGYNDAPNSPMSYMSGSDVLRLKKINASIVFLDACLSGKGAVGTSGSVGIAEAFHLIGAKNVICYLERVQDDLATDFSNRFYQELSKGKSCHDAFFIAKKSINKNIKVVLWE